MTKTKRSLKTLLVLHTKTFEMTILCGAHALERVGEMKSQKIQKGGLFDSADENGVLVKSVEQDSIDHTLNIEEKNELIKPHNILSFLLFAKAMQHLSLTLCLF